MIARTETPLTFRPRLVLAYGDSIQAAHTGRLLRRMGWQVHQTHSGPEARRLVRLLRPGVILLDVDLADESGWLTCTKLMQEFPQQTVILLCDELTPENIEFARFVGAAALASRSAQLLDLVEQVVHPAAEAVSVSA